MARPPDHRVRHDVAVTDAHLHHPLRLAIRDGVTTDRIEPVVGALPPTVSATVDFGLRLLTVSWSKGCDKRAWTETANLLLSSDLFARRIRLYCDYAPWPLWWAPGLPEENNLPMSDELKVRIGRWHNSYLGVDQHAGGTWEPPPETVDVEQAWVEEGNVLRMLIEAELGPGYRVEFDT